MGILFLMNRSFIVSVAVFIIFRLFEVIEFDIVFKFRLLFIIYYIIDLTLYFVCIKVFVCLLFILLVYVFHIDSLCNDIIFI